MRIRLRGPNGVSTLSLEDDATIDDLKTEISKSTGLERFDVRGGFPVKVIDLDSFKDSVLLEETGLKLNGEQLIIEHKSSTTASKPTEEVNPSARISDHSTTEPIGQVPYAQKHDRAQESTQPLSLSRKDNSLTEPPEIPVPSKNGILVIRVMPDDNSCLFRALGSAVLGDSLDAMTELRALVAAQIQQEPDAYSAAILGKEPNAYCRWIQREDSWGGGVEMAILSQQFDIEICSIDVQSLRVDRFNEGRPTRCILVYSGIHYDVLALTPSPDLPAEFDTKVFDAAHDDILAAALQLCQGLQEKHYFTDTARFEIQCRECGWSGNGEKAAVKHAENTGHMDFGES